MLIYIYRYNITHTQVVCIGKTFCTLTQTHTRRALTFIHSAYGKMEMQREYKWGQGFGKQLSAQAYNLLHKVNREMLEILVSIYLYIYPDPAAYPPSPAHHHTAGNLVNSKHKMEVLSLVQFSFGCLFSFLILFFLSQLELLLVLLASAPAT